MSFLTWTFPSGQEVVNPGNQPVLLTARRCDGASPSGSSPTSACKSTAGPTLPWFCCGARRYLRVLPPSLRRHEPLLAPLVPSDALARRTGPADHGTTSGMPVLEVRRTFEPSRLGTACLATAYAQIVPIHQRRVARVDRSRVGLVIDGVRDVSEKAASSERGRS
jgi:hypothetical protein